MYGGAAAVGSCPVALVADRTDEGVASAWACELLGLREDACAAPAVWLARRADAVAVIGAALVAKATGLGHGPTAATLGRPASTVRGWLRRFGARAEDIRGLFTCLLLALDPEASRLLPTGSVFADAVEVLGQAAAAAVVRLSPIGPWEFASRATGGLLLAPPALSDSTGWVMGTVSNTS